VVLRSGIDSPEVLAESVSKQTSIPKLEKENEDTGFTRDLSDPRRIVEQL
jgi:hypothetical protein